MIDILFAFFLTIFLWWFSTSILLVITRKSTLKKNLFLMIIATFLLGFGYVGILWSSNSTSVFSAYIAFISSILIWFWLELSFLVGWATGNRKISCPKNAKGINRAWLAFQVINYNEFLILIIAVSLYILVWDSLNAFGFYSFVVLWVMKISAKINIFLGVRNLYENFLPKKLSYLQTYFRKRSMNPVFPIFVFFAIWVDLLFWNNALTSSNEFLQISYTLLASLLALGILEHFMMVVPFQLNKLWSLGLSEQK